jgi:queuine/archaeosine tRNA-ribosyltransferase
LVDEPTAPRLLTLHNVHWTFELVHRIRASIESGGLGGLRAEIAERWGPGGDGEPGEGRG